ncbi:ArsA-related P-loop ATPase [Desulfococcaceae bacterium HSG9]|nr:ArsA-related P-loop ATPase [Desulfococcaceae bacterium HSG9]
MSGKGGVGKTSVSANFSIVLADMGFPINKLPAMRNWVVYFRGNPLTCFYISVSG